MVTLYYSLDTGLGTVPDYKSEPLKNVYEGIFARAFTLFYGETLRYYFQTEDEMCIRDRAMSPGEGQQVTVVIKEGASAYKVGKTLEQKGLIKDALAFTIQERMSAYHGQIKAGTYLLSTAYTCLLYTSRCV